jgi:hypothetical protein
MHFCVFYKYCSKDFFVSCGIDLLCILQALEEEEKMTPEQLAIKNVGKLVSLLNTDRLRAYF